MSVIKIRNKETGEFIDIPALRGEGGVSTLIVTITDGVASHTSAEIYAHVQSGGTAELHDENLVYFLCGCCPDYATFEHSADDGLLHTYLIYNDGTFDYNDAPSNASLLTTLDGKITRPITAEVGQTIIVKSVDANGRPTAWEAADLPSGGSGSSNVVVAEFELLDDGQNYGITCRTHTASDIRQTLENHIPIIGIIDSEQGWTIETVTVSMGYGGQEINVGCSVADGMWKHRPDVESYYVDGNTSNKIIGNELWGEY